MSTSEDAPPKRRLPGLPLDDDDDLAAGAAPAPAETGGVMAWIWDVVKTWTPAILVVLLIRSVLAEPFRIPSGSMVPTLAIGDHIVVTKFSYGIRIPLTRIPFPGTELEAPERGDVVVFVYPDSDHGLSRYMDLPVPGVATLDYVKRVIGLPGDTVEVRDNVVYLNGKAQSRTYQQDHTFVDDRCTPHQTREYVEDLEGHPHAVLNAKSYGARMGNMPPVEVPEGHIFVMGDNRDHSADSRVWGFVPFRNIKGKAQAVWLSYDWCDSTNTGPLPTMRSGRFGTAIQ